jgi:hypothetical protein
VSQNLQRKPAVLIAERVPLLICQAEGGHATRHNRAEHAQQIYPTS